MQAVDFASLVTAACEADAMIRLPVRAGQNAVPGGIAAVVAPASAASEELCRAVRRAILVGHERTAVQDLEYSIHQLVEIAVRALSPGINDPYTANAVIDRLTLSIARVMRRHPPKSVWQDENGAVRVVADVSTFDGITDAAFNQIRQQAEGTPAVLIRLADNIAQLLALAGPAHRATLEKHLKLVVNAGRRTIGEEADLRDLEDRAKTAR